MANFYYNENDISGIIVPISANWTHNPYGYGSTQQSKQLLTSPKVGGTTSVKSYTDTITSINRVLLGQYISEKLSAGTINLGTVVGYIGARETSSSMNSCPSVIIKLVSEDGQTVRGILLSYLPTTTTNEYNTSTSYYSRVHPTSSTSTSQAAQQGDRIVIEVGTYNNNTVATSYTCSLYLGSNNAYSNIGTTTTSIGSNANPYISFSNELNISPSVTITSYNGLITDQIGDTTSNVIFTSNQDLVSWEARADGEGSGQGILVASGVAEASTLTLYSSNLNTDSSGDGIADEWERYSSCSTGSHEIDTQYSCQKIIMTGATMTTSSYFGISKRFYEIDGNLIVNVNCKKDGNLVICVYIKYYDSNDSFISSVDDKTYDFTEFTSASFPITLPVNTAYMEVDYVLQSTSTSSIGTGWLKSFSITKEATSIFIANTDITFDIENTALTNGYKDYRINIYGQNSVGGWTAYNDYNYFNLNYSAGVLFPIITIKSYTKPKISDEIDMTKSTAVFSINQDILQWEARADGSGLGQGLLVGSGGAILANTDITFDIDYTELTQGDKTYRINIYAQNTSGFWNGYE